MKSNQRLDKELGSNAQVQDIAWRTEEKKNKRQRQERREDKTRQRQRGEKKRREWDRGEEKFGLFVGCVQSQVLSMAACPQSNWVC